MLTGFVGLFLILFQQLAYINFITRKTLLKKDNRSQLLIRMGTHLSKDYYIGEGKIFS